MVLCMNTVDPFIRQRIISAAADLIKEAGSKALDFDMVATRSDVDPATVGDLFDSKTQLVAEAQMSNYFAMVEPLHLVLHRVEAALSSGDEGGFWESVEENFVMAWSSGQVDQKWGILNQLHDIWSDPFSQSHFCDLLDIQFERWIAVVEGAKKHGWIGEHVDARALTAVFWSASVGQVITAGSSSLNLSSIEARDFLLSIVRGSKEEATSFG